MFDDSIVSDSQLEFTTPNLSINGNTDPTHNSKSLTPSEFLSALTKYAPEGSAPIVTSFSSRPDTDNAPRKRWVGKRYDAKDFNYYSVDKNTYVTISAFKGDRRRKAEFSAMLAVMIDDPGTKIDLAKIKMEPSIWLETSPGNYQAWYLLETPETDRARAEGVLKALIDSGLTDDGKDPGMAGVTRYGRTPGGINNKSKLKKPFRVVATTSNNVKRYSIDHLINAFSLEVQPGEDYPNAQSTDDALTARWMFGNHWLGKIFQEQGMVKSAGNGVVHVECPWSSEHSTESDGSSFLIASNGELAGYRCHHGHCHDRGLKAVSAWAEDSGFKKAKQPKATPVELKSEDKALYDLVAEALESRNPSRAIADLKADRPHQRFSIDDYIKEIETESQKAETNEKALKLLKADYPKRLDIDKLLTGDGGVLADAIKETAADMPTAPEFLFTAMVPVLASQMGTKQVLNIRSSKSRRSVTAIFWALIVAESGRLKSPAVKVMMNPLSELEEESRIDYEEAIRDAHDDEVIAPRKRYFVADSTPAARMLIHRQNPTGLMFFKDEGSAFITEIGKFSAKGASNGDREVMLSEFGGDGIQIDRKGTNGKPEDIGLKATAIQRLGTTQFGTLKKLMGDHHDIDGLWSRFLFCAVPAPLALGNEEMDDESEDYQGPEDRIVEIIRKIQRLPASEYRFNPESYQLAMKFQNQLTVEGADADSNEESAYPKFRTYLYRFILFFHILNGVLADDGRMEDRVSVETVEQAIYTTKFYIGQFQTVINLNAKGREDLGHAEVLLRYIERKGGATLRQMYRSGCLKRRGVKAIAGYKEQLQTLLDMDQVVEIDGVFRVAAN